MKELAQVSISDRTIIKLQTGEYQKEPRVDLRLYVRDGEKFIPTKKGINFHAELIDQFVEMVEKLKDE